MVLTLYLAKKSEEAKEKEEKEEKEEEETEEKVEKEKKKKGPWVAPPLDTIRKGKYDNAVSLVHFDFFIYFLD